MKKFEKLSLVKMHDEELKKVIGGASALERNRLLYGIIPKPPVLKYGITPLYGIIVQPLYGISVPLTEEIQAE
ncbi:MAG: hypothetical protein JW881_03435 [Spirochaetales bacterium]|nr:hypothetical protein [Spirochaetales bacterium]